MLDIDRWPRWNNFCWKLRVSSFLTFSGSTRFILSNPFILISSSIRSISWLTSGLHVGTRTLRIFFPDLVENPRELNIFFTSLSVIAKPIIFLNLLTSSSIDLFLYSFFPVTLNLLASPPQIFRIKSVAILRPVSYTHLTLPTKRIV